ncbi:MAG: hypothetical protein PHH62_04615 [Endomicrobiaceae bacterium]|nr:hypothetical protein [Endomicrobiaceae bacterium]
MNNKLKIVSLLIFSLVVSIVFLMFIELMLFLFLPKHYDRLSDILRIIKQDNVLIWKQKPNLNTDFQNQNVKTNSFGFRTHEIKSKNKTRIICLGASPTFGWGVKDENTYPVVIENELKNKNIEIESINAGEIGYSSYQGLKLLKTTILDLKPDIITVSYVINDVDKYRFFRSSSQRDSQLYPLSKWLVNTYNVVYQSNLFNFINNISLKIKSNKSKYYGNKYKNQYNENRRVSINEYEDNLNSIINIAQENNIKVIFIVMPVNLPAKRMLTDAEKMNVDNLLFEAENEMKNNNYIQAKKLFEKILLIDEYFPISYYYLGIIADIEKNSYLADEMFEKAKNYEIFDCADISLKYNDVMRKVSQEKQIPLCDSAKDFIEYKKDYLFVDPKLDCFHPNAKGHHIIANKLVDILMDSYLENKGKIN